MSADLRVTTFAPIRPRKLQLGKAFVFRVRRMLSVTFAPGAAPPGEAPREEEVMEG